MVQGGPPPPVRLPTLLFALCLLWACSGSDEPGPNPDETTRMPEGIRVPVAIDPARPSGTLDERYLGYALDTAQFSGGYWWRQGSEQRQPEETPNLESPKLRRLVSYLAPSRLRIGGTDCDGAYFCPEEGDCELPPSYAEAFRDDEDRLETFLTHEDVRRAADFAAAVGARIMFCVNMGSGPRDPQTGVWTPDNARRLIRYARSLPRGDVFDIWEPGNEVNVLTIHFLTPEPVTPWLFAEDLVAFRAVVDEESPGARVAAPGCYFLPFEPLGDLRFTENLLPAARDLIDIVTWHLYATQSDRCFTAPVPSNQENLFAPSVVATHRAFARYVEAAAGGLPVMNGESASGQCGGQRGLSDTLLDALWYADWIGLMAEEGTSSVVRQTLVGSDYGMLDPETFDPHPTFLALVMFRRKVEGLRLHTDADRTAVKAHGFCTAGMDGSVTAVLSNPTEEALAVEISLAGSDVRAARQWTLGAGGDLTATRATIEGRPALPDGTIPDPPGSPVHLEAGKAYAAVGANALVFVVLTPEAAAGPCVSPIP